MRMRTSTSCCCLAHTQQWHKGNVPPGEVASWRPTSQPSVYEGQALPIGTTCSPCCAVYALQRHAYDHTKPDDVVRASVDNHFYVDNWLQSFPSPDMAKNVTDEMRGLLTEGGFELQQWASNRPGVVSQLLKEIRSRSSEQLLNHTNMDPQEPALGLRWLCHSDTLCHKSRLLDSFPPTMRNIYRVLASQYDPIGFRVLTDTHLAITPQSSQSVVHETLYNN